MMMGPLSLEPPRKKKPLKPIDPKKAVVWLTENKVGVVDEVESITQSLSFSLYLRCWMSCCSPLRTRRLSSKPFPF